MIKADEHFEHIDLVRIGDKTPELGYSAFEFIPGTDDTVVVAIKSKEVEGEPIESYITVFNIDGTVILEDQKLEDNMKFEGLFLL